MPADSPSDGLHWRLLDESMIRWRCVEFGELHHASLPELMAAMAADRVHDFPGLRPHQRHPWHAFLTQLAAISLHQAGQVQPWADAADWRAALLALTPDDPDGAAWCLVAPPQRPALLQAPMLNGIGGWDADVRTPDRLDMLGTSKNHDLKQTRMKRSDPDDWLFALVSLQTQAGSNSGSYKGISRMNSGAGSRPGVGVARRGAWGQRWQSDVRALLRTRAKVADDYGLANDGGRCLTWLVPWDESTSIGFSTLDPYYIEICRRVRLQVEGVEVIARTYKTPTSRIEENTARKGRTGDAWTPVDKEEEKIMAVPRGGFDYERVTELLVGGRYLPSLTQSLVDWSDQAMLELICCGVAADGNSKTSGYHERHIPISPKLRRLLASPQRVTVAEIAKQRIAAIAVLRKLLWSSLLLLFANGDGGERNDGLSERANRFSRPFEQREDGRFFDDLALEAEVEDNERSAQRIQWLLGLVERAEAVLLDAFAAGPRSGMQRYKAQAVALSRFHGGLRGTKPVLPDLAHHYAQQRATHTAETEGEHLG
jgi:CRISPR system Cascade subunit CasA